MTADAVAVVYTVAAISLLAILLWVEHRRFTSRCTCQDRGTFLKPKWKRHDHWKDDG